MDFWTALILGKYTCKVSFKIQRDWNNYKWKEDTLSWVLEQGWVKNEKDLSNLYHL